MVKTSEEFYAEQDRLLDGVPEVVAAFIREYAWGSGHAYGYDEVISNVYNLCDDMRDIIQALKR